MAVTMRPALVAEIIRRALGGQDHRDIVVDLIDASFLSEVLGFFERVVLAKMNSQLISIDWYQDTFLASDIASQELINNAGLNKKTVTNKHGSARREIVVQESLLHYEKLVALIDSLTDDHLNIDLSLTLGDVTVHLNLNESLIVVNALAARRATIRGGAWSSAGKQVEAPLMEVLCRTFEVEDSFFTRALADDGSLREVDFYLRPISEPAAKCEVKLMGTGNPESADVVIARDSRVFVASTLSDLNKRQLDDLGILWTQLQEETGFLKFQQTLDTLGIPYVPLGDDLDFSEKIEAAIRDTFGILSS